MNHRDETIQTALAEFESGVYESLRATARAYGVAETTLRDRRRGATNRRAAHHHQQRLSPPQEDFLVQWILDEDTRMQPPSHARVREMAGRILVMNGDSAPLGKMWLKSFLSRQPRVASIVGRRLESVRAEAAKPALIRDFYQRFERIRLEHNVRLEDIYNVDETGLALGVCNNHQVLASSKKKKAYFKSPETREWVTVVECISATGNKLRPLVIFNGGSLQTDWFPSDIPDWFFTTSQKGWTSNTIGIHWLKSIFDPDTKPSCTTYRMLVIDGHSSHASVDFMWHCRMNKIVVLYLPAHSSHMLQPLDVAPFGKLKPKYRSIINELSTFDDAAPIKKQRFIRSYNQAREEALSKQIIRAGWRGAGIVPLNPAKVLTSSQVSDRPITPPSTVKAIQLVASSIATPQSSRDVYIAQQTLLQSEILSRDTRIILSKAGKAIGILNSKAALLESTNAKLSYLLDELKSKKKKKRITVDLNERFANIDKIHAAVEAAKAEAARIATKDYALQAQRTATAVANSTIEDMTIVFQL